MKRSPYTSVIMLVLMFTSTIVLSQELADIRETIRPIEGTTWIGKDSDGDFYEYTFLKGGQLRYKTNTSRKTSRTFEDKGDVWAQNGKIIIMLKGDFSTQAGNRMEGKAWNFNGKR